MSIAKFVQHVSLSDNEIKEARLEASPVMTGGVLKQGKFGLNSKGAFVYLAGYNGADPVVNEIKEYIVQLSESNGKALLTITKDIAGFKNGIQIHLPNLLERLIQDANRVNNATWSSDRIVTYVESLLPPTPVLDEANLTLELTSEELDELYPNAAVGAVYYSRTQSIRYTKMDIATWIFEIIDIR